MINSQAINIALPEAPSVAAPMGMADPTLTARDARWVTGIMLATLCYQAVLCLLNNYGLHASRALLGLTEACILAACVPLLLRRVLPGVIILAALGGAMFSLLSLVKGELDVKTLRDMAIPLCYFWLGSNIGRPDLANRILIYAISIILAMGFMELFFLDQYTNYFDIYSYYVSTGNLEPVTDYVNTSKLQLNGTRPDGIGRTFFPNLFGPHRVSSVFLEPVSLGNFATLCAAWGLSKEKSQLREMVFFVIVALVMIVISDSRFATTSIILMIGMRLLLSGRAYYLPIFAPFIAIAVLVAMGGEERQLMEDSFRGRLALSGYALHEFDIPTLFAAVVTNVYADMGYAHLISSFGMPLALILWFSLWLLPMPTAQGERFRSFVAVYITLILCVSGFSLYALKTSGVLWFLMGSLMCNPAPRRTKPEFTNPGG